MKRSLIAFLANTLSKEELVTLYKSYDIIGDTAIIRVPESLQEHSQAIAKAVMKTHRHVKAVWRQTSSVSGNLRLRTLEWVACMHA